MPDGIEQLCTDVREMAKAFNEFKVETTNRLTRIETKLNGGYKWTNLTADLIKLVVACALGIIVGAKVI